MNKLSMEGNVGCMYFLRWENMVDDNISTELLWYSNLDTPLEMMDNEELEETLEYIFVDTYGDIVKDVHDWEPNWGIDAYENMGWEK